MNMLKTLLLAAPILMATATTGTVMADDNRSNSTYTDNSTNDNRYYDDSLTFNDNRIDDRSIHAGGDAIVGNTTTNNTTTNKTVNVSGGSVEQSIQQ